ncbi:MAG: hypothetical protein ABID45_00730 [Patescibacteria group bacterium]
MDIETIIMWGTVFIVSLIILFILIRKIVTWYWKINEIVKLLNRIERNTRKDGVTYPDDDDSLL